MVKIDFLILGYRQISIPSDKLSDVTSILLRAKIPSKINNNGTISVRERDFLRVSKLLSDKIEYKATEPKGLYGLIKRTEHKKSILFGSFISLLMILVSGSLIWDIRVDGNEQISDVEIIEGLDSCGFSVGEVFGFKSRSETEHKFLEANPEISWININRRGTVAYVTVIENENKNEEKEPSKNGYSNVIATTDAVIEEITVKRGYAMVKPGDTVKCGDILISGVIPTEGGTQYCYAEGSVIGRLKEEISAECDREYLKKTASEEKISSLSVKIFNFQTNILKKYGNQYLECDIIKDVKTFSLLGRCKLPIEILTEKTVVKENGVGIYSDAQLVLVVSEMLSAKTAARLSSSDLLRINTSGEFTDTGYRMRSVIVFTDEIGTDAPFTAE